MTRIAEGLMALWAVQKRIPGAVLAGGYLRDALTDHAPKDIDIFVPSSATEADLEALGAKAMIGAAEYMEQKEVATIYDVAGFELPVQVIVLCPGLDPIERAKRHDFGICQVWHDGTEQGMTGFFSQDLMARTFTLVDCETQAEYDRSMRRWERLSLKFPGWRLVVPEPHRQFDTRGALA